MLNECVYFILISINLYRKWKTGTDSVTAMLVSSSGRTLLTASRSIKWWDVEKQTVIKIFTGHASPVFTMAYISVPSGDEYVISAAQNDRLLNAWYIFCFRIQCIIYSFQKPPLLYGNRIWDYIYVYNFFHVFLLY